MRTRKYGIYEPENMEYENQGIWNMRIRKYGIYEPGNVEYENQEIRYI